MQNFIKFKVVLLGDQNVGKTSLISRFINNKFNQHSNPTVGIDFMTKNMSIKGQNIKLQLWDTAGQERFRSLIPSYVRDSNCCLIVVDVTARSSMQGVSKWYEFVKQERGHDAIIIIVGNKIDANNRTVQKQQLVNFAKQNEIFFIEVSAKDGTNINLLFNKIAQKLLQNNNMPTEQTPRNKKRQILLTKKQVVKKQKKCSC